MFKIHCGGDWSVSTYQAAGAFYLQHDELFFPCENWNDLPVAMLEGVYTDTYKPTSGAHLTRTLYFDIGESDDISLTLDVFSMHKILPVMEEGQLYRVWYEANTEIIVKCEAI